MSPFIDNNGYLQPDLPWPQKAPQVPSAIETQAVPGSISDAIQKHLVSNGMFPQQAKAVLEEVMALPENEPMQGRWDSQMSDYPQVLQKALILSANNQALSWIDRNLPLAWFRPMFSGELD